MERQNRRGGLSAAGGVAALALSVIFVVIWYAFVRFPSNIPLGVGTGVVVAEAGEILIRTGAISPSGALRIVLHAGVAGLASWLGVVFSRAVGIL